MKRKYLKNGFTLIEVLISLSLFAVISISIMDVLDQTTKSQGKIKQIIKKNRILPNVLHIVRKDLQMSFASSNMKSWMRNSYKDYLEKFGESDYITSYMDESDQIYFDRYDFDKTGLRGEKDFFIFTSTSQNISGQPPVIKIGYFIEDCPLTEVETIIVKCLIRKTSLLKGNALSDFHQDSLKHFILLKNIKNFEISYHDPVDLEWKTSFSPYLLRGMYFPHPFPLALKLNLEIENVERPVSVTIPIYLSLLSLNVLNKNSLSFQHNALMRKSKKENQ